MAKSDAGKTAKAGSEDTEALDGLAPDSAAETVNAAGANQWARAVVDGVPSDAEAVQEIVDAEIVDAEIVDPETVEEANPVEEVDAAMAKIDEDAEASVEEETDKLVDGLAANPEGAGEADADPATGNPASDISVEDLVLDLERVTSERDQYLDASRRLQAEFENYKKQVSKREIEARERANDSLIGELLPVLDAFDGAVANGAEDVVPMRSSFLDALGKQGLERIDPSDAPFDPNLHEAVLHEDADDSDGPVVAEVMRAGYVWKGRVLRPAMVRTRG